MEYVKYKHLVSTHGVHLVDYPLPAITSPSNITSMTDLRKLRDALKTRTCKWVRMTPDEYKEHADKVANEADDEEPATGKTRKRRSDAGKPRAKRARVDKENERPKKTKSSKTKKSKKGPLSREVISDDDADDDVPALIGDDEILGMDT